MDANSSAGWVMLFDILLLMGGDFSAGCLMLVDNVLMMSG